MLLTHDELKTRDNDRTEATARREVVRDKLYYTFRYRRGSYKARKAMIHPFLIVVKRGNTELRLYDNGSHQPTITQMATMVTKCKGWRQKEREIKRLQMPEYKKWLAQNNHTRKQYPFSYWRKQQAVV